MEKQRKDTVLSFRLTKAEAEKIKRKAKEQGLKLSEYLFQKVK